MLICYVTYYNKGEMGMRFKQLPILFFTTLLYMLFHSYALAIEPIAVGKVDYVRGVVSAKSATGAGRLLGQKDAPIYKTDSIITGNTSFAVLVFADGTKVTVRPKSVFVISDYQFKRNTNDKAFFRLLKGGVRTVTGAINNNNASDNITLETPSSSVSISERNTDIVMRSCDGNCDDHTNPYADSQIVARIALAKGNVYVRNNAGNRTIKTGDKLAAQDTIITDANAFAILVFTDKTRVTLESATEFKIAEYAFPKGRPKQGNILFNLVSGGARTLTGLIAKSNPQKFKLKTLVATMGVRGTGFDTYFENQTQTYVNVWQGGVTATRDGMTQNIDLNQTLRIGNDGFQRLQRLPPRIQNKFRQNLRPDRVNTQNTFMSVKRGNANLSNTGRKQQQNQANQQTQGQRIRLSAGESAVANRSQLTKTTHTPQVISNDPYTTVAPSQVQSSLQKNLNKSSNQGRGGQRQEQGQRQGQQQGQGNRQNQGRDNRSDNRFENFNPRGEQGGKGSRGVNDFDSFDNFDRQPNNPSNFGQPHGAGGHQGPRPPR